MAPAAQRFWIGCGSHHVPFPPTCRADSGVSRGVCAVSVNGRPAHTPMRNRILVVDDYTAAARALASFLTAIGYEVAVAFDAPRAVELVPTFRPHFVLVDLNLAGMDGCAVAQRLRADGTLGDAGLLAMSG